MGILRGLHCTRGSRGSLAIQALRTVSWRGGGCVLPDFPLTLAPPFFLPSCQLHSWKLFGNKAPLLPARLVVVLGAGGGGGCGQPGALSVA